MFDPSEAAPEEEHTASDDDYSASESDSAALDDSYTALKESYTTLRNDYAALRENYTVLKDDYIALMGDYVTLKDGDDIPVADDGSGDEATDSKASGEQKDSPADLPKGMEMPIEMTPIWQRCWSRWLPKGKEMPAGLTKEAFASAIRTAHSSPSGDVKQGITDPWVQDETANPVGSPDGQGMGVEGDRFEPDSRITEGGELLIVGQALDAQTPGF
ncbi:hypothetical protein D5038_09745 [Verminephrobacter aporrectodeae subsp. tuberculatae]|uniref:hypothetical protein n=1 Tax=Verminephrobacter aporrectodeae TaxID=1110389 RepID=UPI0022387B3F|nr:hypothetical protein [Verminephrobacter aporrectodeae]MCW5256619.1 hypothetical protein [Verminephrobacter aporrectodeae subsp. tuberculatae]